MHVGVVNYLAGWQFMTIEIANIDMLRASFYDSSYDGTKCPLIVAIDRERRCIFAMYISGDLEQPFRFTQSLGAGDVYGCGC